MPHFQFYDSVSRPDWHSKCFFCQGLASQVREKPLRAQGPVMGGVGWAIVITPASTLQARGLAWISLKPQSTDPLVFYNLAGEVFSEGWCWLSMRHPSNPAGCLLTRCQTTARGQKSREPCKGGRTPRAAAWQLSILWHQLPLPRLT